MRVYATTTHNTVATHHEGSLHQCQEVRQNFRYVASPVAMQRLVAGVRAFQTDSSEFSGNSLQSSASASQMSLQSNGDVTSYRALINADIKTAYGREATDEDYKYWLPKLTGPNDSGFVTSGQMTATEYWHRRLLGWQAGGADVATSGPYAGGGEAHGPVPAATDVVPGVPKGLAASPSASPAAFASNLLVAPVSAAAKSAFRALIAADMKTAYGREATDEDYAYWLPKLEGPCDSALVTSGQMTSTEYWHRRMLGWQAEGKDAATAGPYAGGGNAHGAVPPATAVVRGI